MFEAGDETDRRPVKARMCKKKGVYIILANEQDYRNASLNEL